MGLHFADSLLAPDQRAALRPLARRVLGQGHAEDSFEPGVMCRVGLHLGCTLIVRAVPRTLRGPGRQARLRIAPVPFTLKNLKADLDDVGSNFDGAPDLEFRLATQALGLEQSGLRSEERRVGKEWRCRWGARDDSASH